LNHTVYVGFETGSDERRVLEEVFGDGYSLQFWKSPPNQAVDALLVAYVSASAPVGDLSDTYKLIRELSSFSHLRAIQTVSAGVDGFPFSLVPESVVILSNAGAYARPIAEHTFGMILALSKRLLQNHVLLTQNVFDQRTPSTFLATRVLGILGYGGNGSAIARLGKCFGMRVCALSRSGRKDEWVDKAYTLRELNTFLAACDILVVTAPLNKESAGMINRERLNLMKRDAILVNIGRAEVIAKEDLFHHLLENPSFQAALDVWWNEPTRGRDFSDDLKFTHLPNVLASPHNSGVVVGIFPEVLRAAALNLKAFLEGKGYRNVVNRTDYE
jgi:phosphoglycerate dehydrogenase-like enzyme